MQFIFIPLNIIFIIVIILINKYKDKMCKKRSLFLLVAYIIYEISSYYFYADYHPILDILIFIFLADKILSIVTAISNGQIK